MLLHPPTPLSSLLTPVTHPQDLHPLWSQLTDEHTWKQTLLNRLQLLFHSCVYRIIWILNLIPKWEPTVWVRTPGFSARAMEEVTQHSSSEVLQDGMQPSGGLTPVRLRLVLMQCLGASVKSFPLWANNIPKRWRVQSKQQKTQHGTLMQKRFQKVKAGRSYLTLAL